jgi:hypothetical protein
MSVVTAKECRRPATVASSVICRNRKPSSLRRSSAWLSAVARAPRHIRARCARTPRPNAGRCCDSTEAARRPMSPTCLRDFRRSESPNRQRAARNRALRLAMNEERLNASTFAWSERQQRPGIADTYAWGRLVSLRSCSPERLKAFSVTFPNPGATNGQRRAAKALLGGWLDVWR